MRPLVVTIWVFINLLFFGMCGYMYVLWSQYWLYMVDEVNPTPSPYDQQIYLYNHGFMPTERYLQVHNKKEINIQKRNTSILFVKHSKPRFPNTGSTDVDFDSKKYRCGKNVNEYNCLSRTTEFRDKLLKELRKVLLDESSAFKSGMDNLYGVDFNSNRQDFQDSTPQQLLCEMKKSTYTTLKKSNLPYNSQLRQYVPKRTFFENKAYNSCVIVSSAGALHRSNLGKFIDSHDVVLRFNNAPVRNHEKDVGRKTTIRVLNSQVVSKKEFDFLNSDLYKNVTLIAWDPSNYSSGLVEWLQKPEYNLFQNYMEYKKRVPKARFYLIEPSSIWNLWRFLQSASTARLRRNPPSSGFLGLRLLLPVCEFVDVVEYIPSSRVTKRCHYYDAEENPACTFGIWHPLAIEKLITYHVNTLNDTEVFQRGIARVPGFRKLQCLS